MRCCQSLSENLGKDGNVGVAFPKGEILVLAFQVLLCDLVQVTEPLWASPLGPGFVSASFSSNILEIAILNSDRFPQSKLLL